MRTKTPRNVVGGRRISCTLQSPKADWAVSFIAKNSVGWDRNNRMTTECQKTAAASGIGPERGRVCLLPGCVDKHNRGQMEDRSNL